MLICPLSAFGLGTMVYIGLEFGSWFEVPWDSPCYQAVRGVNPVLQLIFTFSQMYFVFMNSRVILNFSTSHQLKSSKTRITVYMPSLTTQLHERFL